MAKLLKIPRKLDENQLNIHDDNPSLFYEEGKHYEITINPKLQFKQFGWKRRLVKSVEETVKLLQPFVDHGYIEIYLNLEISEIRYGNYARGPDERVHYHGVVKVLDYLPFIMVVLPTLKKISDIQLSQYRKEWEIYINKQQHYVSKLMKEEGVKYPIELQHTGDPVEDPSSNTEPDLDAMSKEEQDRTVEAIRDDSKQEVLKQFGFRSLPQEDNPLPNVTRPRKRRAGRNGGTK